MTKRPSQDLLSSLATARMFETNRKPAKDRLKQPGDEQQFLDDHISDVTPPSK